MKSTELFVEQTLTGFLVLTAAAAPFLSWETLEKLPDEAKGGIDISSAAGAIGAAYLLGVIFDRFADTLLERFNRWNRLLFAIELKEKNEGLSPDDPFPEDRLQIEVIHQGDEAWEWMDYLRSRIRIARAMAAFVPALTLSMVLAMGLRDQPGHGQSGPRYCRRRVRGGVSREPDPRKVLAGGCRRRSICAPMRTVNAHAPA